MIKVLQGDVIEMLRTLPAESVHCCICSPPYWGLRSYLPDGHENKPHELGLEPTLGEHLEKMAEVFAEVWRVLRKDGTVWLNYGDCYATSANGRSAADTKAAGNDDRTFRDKPFSTVGPIYDPDYRKRATGGIHAERRPDSGGRIVAGGTLKPKDLCMVSNRLAIALQEWGWWVRSEIVWMKPNPMPESVSDRPTQAHEKVWLLTKSARYFYDADAVREITGNEASWEEYVEADGRKAPSGNLQAGVNAGFGSKKDSFTHPAGRNLRNVWQIATHPLKHVSVYGSYRIGLPDCPVHGYQAGQLPVQRYDAPPIASDPPRSLGTFGRLSLGQEGVAYAIAEDQYGFLSDLTSARAHSNEIRRRANGSGQDETSDDTQDPRTECIELVIRYDATSDRISESNTSPDVSVDELANCLSEQSPCHILGIATFKDPPENCSCEHIGKVEKKQDHFASFPPKLAERCIKAGTSEKGVCGDCGAPWVREVEVTDEYKAWAKTQRFYGDGGQGSVDLPPGTNSATVPPKGKTTGWRPSCSCSTKGFNIKPATVLDCFAGSGTTGLVADRLQRDAVLIDLNTEYCEMGMKRIKDDAPLFAEVT